MTRSVVLVLLPLLCCAYGLDRETFLKQLNVKEDVSSRCQTHLNALLNALLNGETWALSMVDAFGSIPKGIMKGNTEDIGFYDECVDIAHQIEEDEDTIKGRYCYAGLIFPLPNISLIVQQTKMQLPSVVYDLRSSINIREEENATIPITPLLLSACIPDGCMPSELFGSLGVDTYCETKNENRTLDAADISCLVFFIVIAVLVVLNSLYDVYLHKNDKKAAHPILIAFSLLTNGKKILQVSTAQNQILCFNGLKVISLFWVIVGHRYSVQQSRGVMNYDDTYSWMRRWYAVYITMAPMAVDTFLFVSGALMTYQFLKTMRRPKARFNIFLYYLHRYLRLTPALAVLYFFQVSLMRKLSDGPLWQPVFQLTREKCLNASWSFFLYVQNYVQDSQSLCLLHTWYLSIDMQFFIISPLILIPLLKWPKPMTYFGMPLLIILSTILPMFIIYYYDIQAWTDDYYNLFYYVSHTRFPPWLIGIAFGVFLLKHHDNKEKYTLNNKFLVLSIWVAIFAVVAAVVFAQDDVYFNHNTIKSSLYIPLQRPIWGIFLSWVSYACLTDNAGPINLFLSMPFFQTVSKSLYSIYLIHGSLLVHYLGSQRTLGYFSDYEGLYKATADIPIAVTFGTIWALAFESPMITIEKVIFGGAGKPKKKAQNKGENGIKTETAVNLEDGDKNKI